MEKIVFNQVAETHINEGIYNQKSNHQGVKSNRNDLDNEKSSVIAILKRLDRIEKNTLLSAKNVLSFKDALLLTGLSKSSLYKLTRENVIAHYKPNGRLIYFDRKEIEDWMRQNRICTTQEIEQKYSKKYENKNRIAGRNKK